MKVIFMFILLISCSKDPSVDSSSSKDDSYSRVSKTLGIIDQALASISNSNSNSGTASISGILKLSSSTCETSERDDGISCTENGSPCLDGEKLDQADESYSQANAYCLTSFNTYSPDSSRGVLHLAKGFLCIAESEGVFDSLSAEGDTDSKSGLDFTIQYTPGGDNCFGESEEVVTKLLDGQTSYSLTDVTIAAEQLSGVSGVFDYKLTFSISSENSTLYVKNNSDIVAALFIDGDNAWSISLDLNEGELRFENIDSRYRRVRLLAEGTVDSDGIFSNIDYLSGWKIEYCEGNTNYWSEFTSFFGSDNKGFVGNVIRNDSYNSTDCDNVSADPNDNQFTYVTRYNCNGGDCDRLPSIETSERGINNLIGDNISTAVTALNSSANPLDFFSVGLNNIFNPGWAQMSEAPIVGRDSFAEAWTGEEMIIWGGNNGDGSLNTGALYNPDNDSWTEMPTTNAPSPRGDLENGGLFISYTDSEDNIKNQFFVFGGGCVSEAYYNHGSRVSNLDGGLYDIDSNSWSYLTTVDAPGGRPYVQRAWTGEKVIVYGGNHGLDPLPEVTGEITQQNIQDAVEAQAGSSECPDYSSGILNIGSDSYVEANPVIAHLYDPVNESWSEITEVDAPTQRKHESIVWTNDQLFIFGGAFEHGTGSDDLYNSSLLFDETYFLDPTSGGTWELLSNNSYTPSEREFAPAVFNGRYVFLINGIYVTEADSYTIASGGGIFDTQTNSWIEMSTSGAPTSFTSIVWSGTHLIAYGGMTINSTFASASITSEVYLYDLAKDEWTSVSLPSFYETRSGARGVWADDRLLMWGGVSEPFTTTSENFLSSGLIYFPN
ncbi:MAG: hypothetical protein HOJ35_10630 [Bdellovibrionales bacterium]|nr:hypothetical protein [Bdellovibrionales bacterium]